MLMKGEEKELWDLVEPYLDGCTLPNDVPPEIKKAWDRLYELAWDDPWQ